MPGTGDGRRAFLRSGEGRAFFIYISVPLKSRSFILRTTYTLPCRNLTAEPARTASETSKRGTPERLQIFLHKKFFSAGTVLKPEGVRNFRHDAKAEFFIQMLCALVAFHELKLHDPGTAFLRCSYEFFKHGRPDAEVPEILKDRNCNGCPMRGFHSASEADLTVARNFAVYIAGDAQCIGRGAETVYPRFLLFHSDVPFLGITCEKLGFAARFLYIIQPLMGG